MVFKPDGSEPGRYDKVHLVYFGEVLPFRFGRLRFLYLWLNGLVPFSDGGRLEYSLFHGSGFHRFEMEPPSQPGRKYRFGIPICYEDVMPYVSREFVCGGHPEKQADFLLNISNDGWFGRGHQQPQHLAICTFRAVENRVGIARAVNTGVSAIIDPDGSIHTRVDADPQGRWSGAIGYAVGKLRVDSRYTLYSRYGDWFAWSCAAIWLIFFADYWITRARTRGREPRLAA
jgi:apolipoprotein N-acyltransferase